MGRYYSGDIEGKFWVAVQSSGDASFFGGQSWEPNYLNYSFYEEDLPTIEHGVEACQKALGKYKVKMDKFFAVHDFYSDIDLSIALKVPEPQTKLLTEWYARLLLGEKILKSVNDIGQCEFKAEY